MRVLLSLFILLLPGFSLFAQLKKSDSLEEVLKRTVTHDTNRVIVLNKLNDLYRTSNPDRAIVLADEAIDISNQLKYGRGLTNAVSAKGSALVNKGKPDEAIKLYEDNKQVIFSYGFPRGYCLISLRVGFAYINSGRPSEAISAFKKGIPECEKYEQYDALSDMHRGTGMAYTTVGDHEKATQSFIHAIEAAEKGSLPMQVGYAYITLGNSQINQKDSIGALNSYRHALLILDTLKNDYGRAGCYICIGNVYLYQKKYDSALVNYQKCLDIRVAMNNDPVGVASVKENIATVLLEQGNPEQALPYFQEGLEVFAAANDQGGITGSYSNIGKAHLAMKNYAEAEKNYLSALGPARKANANNFIQECFDGLAKVYYETGRYKEAAQYKDSLIHITDIIVGEQHAAQSKEIEARFQNQQNEEQIAHLQEVGTQQLELATKQKQIIIAVSVGLALVFFLMLFAVRANAQRKKANAKLTEQNVIIAEKNKDITDSITYARRIQQSVLPDEELLCTNVDQAFILYAPRDIVSGDFYWFRKEGSRLYVACADCTGHGVPGALVSVIGVNLLEQIITAQPAIPTGELLDQLHRMMHAAMHKDSLSKGASDGMDIAVLCFDSDHVEFSGAARPALRYDRTSLVQVKGDRFSIGGVKELDSEVRFNTHRFPLQKGDTYYLFTDGYADQFGGPEGKKFMSKKFFELINTHMQKNLAEQESTIEQQFRSWKGSLEQVDDVLVIGVRV